jgi:hypothetical protein
MRWNLSGFCFIGIGAILSLALWTPIPLYCFLGVSLLVTMLATILYEAWTRW